MTDTIPKGEVQRGGAQVIPRPIGSRPGGPPPWAHVPEAERRIDLPSLRDALARSGPPRLSPLEGAGVRASAVVAPLYEHDGELWMVLTRRSPHLRSHSGEVSFPGGGQDEGETYLETAIREAREEINLLDEMEIIGELDHLQTVTSKSFIVPYVGVIHRKPELEANPHEVAHILHVPVNELLLDEVFREERWGLPPLDRPLYFFELMGDTVWGATGFMLHNLLSIATGVEPR